MKRTIIIGLIFVLTGCASAVSKIAKNTEANAIVSKKRMDDTTVNFEKPPVLASNFIWGINGHPVTSPDYWELSAMDLQVKALKQLQTTMYRFNVVTDLNGGLTHYKKDKTRWDEISSRCKNGSIKILPVLQFKPLGTTLTLDESYQAGRKKAYGFAKEYGAEIDYYEIGNEMDLVTIKDGDDGSQIDHYHKDQFDIVAAYLNGMSDGIKEADPAAKTIINSAGSSRWGFFKLLEEANVSYDIIGWHWYSRSGTYEDPYVKKDLERNVFVELAKITDRPIWITEINQHRGTFKHSKETQAVWLERFIDALDNNNQVEGYFVYELLNQLNLDDKIGYEHPVEAYFGLVNASNLLKPIYNPAFETLTFKIEESLHWKENYLKHLFSKLLERELRPTDLAFWEEPLTKNTLDQFIAAFYKVEKPKISEASDLLFIQNSYKQLFSVAISPNESKFWTKKLREGTSRVDVSKSLVRSRKFYIEAIINGYEKRTGFTFKK